MHLYSSLILVADLRIHRGGVCAVTLNGEVYAIGGNDGVQSKACCEKYSPLLDKWENIPIMQQVKNYLIILKYHTREMFAINEVTKILRDERGPGPR